MGLREDVREFLEDIGFEISYTRPEWTIVERDNPGPEEVLVDHDLTLEQVKSLLRKKDISTERISR